MPYKMDKILTDNGKQFVYTSSSYKKLHNNDTSNDEKQSLFTKLCISNEIEHRQTLAYHPWTNRQVERINRTIKDATIKVLLQKLQRASKSFKYLLKRL